MRRFVPLFLGLFLLTAPAQAQLCDPDNAGGSLESAYNLGLLNTSFYLSNCLDPNNDRDDFFRFNLTGPGVVNAMANAARSGVTVELLNSVGVRLTSSQGTAGQPVVVGHLLAAGTYYLRLTGVSARTEYTMTVNPDIQTQVIPLKAGTSIAWSNIVSIINGPRSVRFQVVQPANAGSYFVVNGVTRPVDAVPWTLAGRDYAMLRYVAGTAGSVETVYFQIEGFLWQAARITSVPP